ncbi:uncharacterized protein J4E92_008287 [Alternaria infectoria]|uniref:uncharacterized protein n=1 Tax=Alternaria infectoria TaxID=45303 RepID=UPI00221E82E6|nr:uncharacterized protein J4E92_008287 [Alternaria infectoria]KAI4920644.1 hypothetical protein J4E92_008287 [Alternaria infectoria]
MATHVKMTANQPPSEYFEELARNNQLNSPLLRLPGETRNRIYEYVFFDSEVVAKERWGPQDYSMPRHNKSVIYVLATCQQIRHEATKIFWDRCTINAKAICDIQRVNLYMGPANSALVTSLLVDSYAVTSLIHRSGALPLRVPWDLQQFPMLRKLRVVNIPHFPLKAQEDILRGISALGIAVEYKYLEE